MLADLLNRVSDHEMFRLFDSCDEARAFLLSHDTPPPALRYDLDELLGDDAAAQFEEPESDKPTDADFPEDES